MSIATVHLEVDLVTIPGSGASSRTVAALPPSAADAAAGKMQVYVAGSLILRDYDPVMEQP